MNTRERNLLIVLIVIVGGGIGLYAGNRFLLDPLLDYNAKIEKLTEETDETENKLKTFYVERRKLILARTKSLPSSEAQATATYMAYLNKLLEDNGLVVELITHTAAQKVKVVTPIPNVKETGHQMIPFTVRMRGEIGSLISAMEQMQATPYEHRIRGIVIDRNESQSTKTTAKLAIVMTVEALIVGKTPSKPGMLPGVDPYYVVADAFANRGGLLPMGVLAATAMHKKSMQTPVGRDYAMIAEKNIFVGYVPPPPVKPKPKPVDVVKVKEKEKEEPDTRPVPPPEFTPRYWYLTQTLPESQEAFFRNHAYPPPRDFPDQSEIKLTAKKDRYDVLRVTDEEGEYVFFRAKILKVDLSGVYFQVKDNVYKVKTGQNLGDAMGYLPSYKAQIGQNLIDEDEGYPVTIPLNRYWLNMDTVAIFDQKWAADEAANEKKSKKDNKKKTFKFGPR